ncbi:hypothetical protein [Paenibacillus planticolens]|uniref:hypothetical protein n=1 Tax=Paenibacillus planticolens TaxID=2654976 RepID=UPI0014912DB1|nr:hypothetical protein [Paenibacillus planticolens]
MTYQFMFFNVKKTANPTVAKCHRRAFGYAYHSIAGAVFLPDIPEIQPYACGENCDFKRQAGRWHQTNHISF